MATGVRPVCRRGRRALAPHRLPRSERQHARDRGLSGRLRGHARRALSRPRHAAGRPHRSAPNRPNRWLDDLGALPRRPVDRLGLQPPRQQRHLSALGLPTGALHPVGQAAVDPRAPSAAALAFAARRSLVRARARARDAEYGGVFYGFGPDFAVCDDRKYHWVQAETLACAALLGARTGNAVHRDWYDHLWAYCWQNWVDHRHGAWLRLLSRTNVNTTDEKSPAGKVDHHTMGACCGIVGALKHTSPAGR